MASTALINGINYSWGNIALVLFGVPIVGITKISYSAKQSKENNYGIGFEPISRGYGNREYEGSIELYLDEWKKIINASPNKDPLQIAPFSIKVVFGGTAVNPNTETLQFCEFLENPLDANQGDTKLMVTIPLVIGGILR